ncbi:MAG: asparagine synthase (glutamine-hydrolyzing) [Bacteroidia bacterium]|nr:asparagine synthase (glutamine-hydrolyzing) [Bacteroidia bacterium]
MCGIVGIYNIDRRPVQEEVLKEMTRQLSHRGPDDEGFYQYQHVGLGHRRLSILDLSEKGRQPMVSEDEEWVIVFNGCIYNYIELKEEMIKKGKAFKSSTDTEAILRGLEIYGIDIFPRLNGMFAVAAYHKPTDTLYLSRDRYGIKPLYYTIINQTCLFASEIKAFLKHPDFKVEINLHALNEYFTFQNLFDYQTLFKGVIMLPPANTVKVDANTGNTIKHHSWWNYDFSHTDNTLTFDDAVSETRRLLQQAVKRQMISDVPVGSYLSGGMDSGSITAIASSLIPRISTFTAGFDLSTVTGVEANYDERRDAELMASYFKTEHYEQVINAGDLSWSLPKVVWHLEDLRVGMSYPNYYISRLASKFVKVCLQGTGGDELFGGYPWRYYRVFKSLDQKEFFDNYYSFWQRLVPDGEKKELFKPEIYNAVDHLEPRRIFERVFLFNNKLKYDTPEDHINNSLYFEIKTFLSGLLIVGDRLSMANGLEERYPFLDNDLVEFAMRIPVRYKLGNLEKMIKLDENLTGKKMIYREFDDGKNVLRKAMSQIIPQEIIQRKKQGFSAPDESWYRGENAQYVKELLGRNACLYEFIQKKYVDKIIHEHINLRINHRLLIWSFICFEWWCRIFLKKNVAYDS